MELNSGYLLAVFILVYLVAWLTQAQLCSLLAVFALWALLTSPVVSNYLSQISLPELSLFGIAIAPVLVYFFLAVVAMGMVLICKITWEKRSREPFLGKGL